MILHCVLLNELNDLSVIIVNYGFELYKCKNFLYIFFFIYSALLIMVNISRAADLVSEFLSHTPQTSGRIE